MKHIFVSLLFMLACGSVYSNSLQMSQPEGLQSLRSATQMTLPSLSETTEDVGDVEVNYDIENCVTVAFMNEVVYPNDDYSFTKITNYETWPTDYRKDLPLPVRIEAPIPTDDATAFLLEIYSNGSLVRSDTFSIDSTTLKIWNLIPQTRYSYKLYQIAADGTKIEESKSEGSFKTKGQVRMMNIGGMCNFRDLGGWKLPGGMRIKYDKIFRSGELEIPNSTQVKITDAGIHELLDVQHIGVEIDFGDHPGSPVSGQLDYYNGSDYQICQYAGGLHRYGEQYKNCFNQVLAGLRQGKKILFHCNKGNDRTGSFAFLLEGLLGVSESDLAKDYELTSFKYSGRYRNLETSDHKNGYKGVIYYVNKYFKGNTLNEKIEQMALGMGIRPEDINDFRSLMTEPDGGIVEGNYHIEYGIVNHMSEIDVTSVIEENYHIENGATSAFMNDVAYPDGDYSFTKITNYETRPTDYRKDLPLPVRIEAPIPTDDATAFLLETYSNETLVRSDTFSVNQRALEIRNLIPQTRYTYNLYLIKSGAVQELKRTGLFKTEGQVRMMSIDSMYNFRDLGGWKLPDGKRIKYDKIFRSGELEIPNSTQVKITDVGIHELLDVQHIEVEIDFGDHPGSPVSGQLDYYNGADYQIVGYAGGLHRYGEQYKNCFNQVLAGLRQGKKILFHCNEGADRTGTFAFLLEGLLGVSESDLAKDYELTSFKYSGRYRNLESSDHKKGYKGVIYYVNKYFKGNTLNEKIEQMALRMGIHPEDINDFRELMTEPDVEMTGNKNAFFARQRGTDNQTLGIYEQHKSSDDMNYPNFGANSPLYNLAGQRVGKNYKGLVIINGKKILNN